MINVVFFKEMVRGKNEGVPNVLCDTTLNIETLNLNKLQPNFNGSNTFGTMKKMFETVAVRAYEC